MNSEFNQALNIAIKHIGIATYSSGKIFVYLSGKGFSEAICREVTDELVSRGFIDDYKASKKVLFNRTGKKQESKSYIFQRLLQAGINEYVAEDICSGLEDDLSTCISMLKASNIDSDREMMIKLALRRGYEYSIANKAVNILNK